MADFIFNIARGATKFYYFAVENSTVLAASGQFTAAADSSLIVVGIDAGGVADTALRDFDDLAAVLASAANEVTSTNYARKVLTESDLVAVPVPDDANDRYDLDVPDQTWVNVVSNGATPNFTDLLVCFRPAAGSADSAIIPISCHDFVSTADGSDIVAQINAAGFYRSQ
jgi:hypothetical protein